ncbi:stalk domain-containing protein [Cohnella sp.]|uniref:stalk domain-containing protein n=1 Tax=Cohnella sp. TaxID=1883426 RepID=UPI003569B68F
MKSKLSLLLGAAIVLSSVSTAAAAEVKPGEASIQQVSSAVQLVPLRKVFTDFGATVDWDNETSSAIIEWDDMSIIVDLMDKSALYGGKQFFFEGDTIKKAAGKINVSVEFIETVAQGKLVETAGVYTIVKEEEAAK